VSIADAGGKPNPLFKKVEQKRESIFGSTFSKGGFSGPFQKTLQILIKSLNYIRFLIIIVFRQ
jgi:hypothetical protein